MNTLGKVVLGILAALALGSSALYVQHYRHGWPFSLHHGLAAHGPAASLQPNLASTQSLGPTRVAIELPAEQVERLGVRVEAVTRQELSAPIRAVATVVPDESRISHVHTRVAGWLEALHVNTTGQRVRAGQPLAGIFSQELLAAQMEYLAARRAASTGPASAVAAGARSRLKVLGVSDNEVRALEDSGQPRRLVIVSSPRSGVVLRLSVSVGSAVDPGTEIVTVGDLSRVWVLAEIPEANIPFVQKGAVATLSFPGSGLDALAAPVEFLYPMLSERTRTLRVRFAVENPSGTLRPGLYGSADFEVTPRSVLVVSRDAVVDTGAEQHVFVVTGPRHYEPRQVTLGVHLQDQVEIRSGLAEGERVVASGVFLIDSESRLRSSSGAGVGHAGHSSPKAPNDTASSAAAQPALGGAETKPAAPTVAPVDPHRGH
jgi:membrane fusion protein, copper/silver efflux system